MKIFLIILCFVSSLVSQKLYANDSLKSKTLLPNYYKSGFAIGGGIGASTAVHGALSANFSFEIQNKSQVFGMLLGGNYQTGGSLLGGSYPNDRAIEQSLYFGQRISSKAHSLAFCLGIGMISFTEKDITKPIRYDWLSAYYQTKTTDVVGADIILKGIIREKGFGVGLMLHGNINQHCSFFNCTLFLQLGAVWHRKPGDARKD